MCEAWTASDCKTSSSANCVQHYGKETESNLLLKMSKLKYWNKEKGTGLFFCRPSSGKYSNSPNPDYRNKPISVSSQEGCRFPENNNECKEHYEYRPIFDSGACRPMYHTDCNENEMVDKNFTSCKRITDDAGCEMRYGKEKRYWYGGKCNKFQECDATQKTLHDSEDEDKATKRWCCDQHKLTVRTYNETISSAKDDAMRKEFIRNHLV